MKSALRFPRKFVWGVAAAAPQIEGGAAEDGKGESIWDRFARTPGKVRGGDTPAVACDHYHRYRQDFQLMKRLGVRHYRLSIAWPRIYPSGDGTLNPKGLDFYHRLIDAMLDAGITPWVTLFHWDLPQALQDRGGWPKRLVADAFRPYARTVVKALGDRVKNWITLNEITCFAGAGYIRNGEKAPGVVVSPKDLAQNFHNALLCHGHAVQAVRELGGRRARVGLTDNSEVFIPVTETPDDIAAARTLFLERNCRILEPIFHGRYSPATLRKLKLAMPTIARGDMDLITEPTDFLGLNIYTGTFVRSGRRGRPETLPFPPEYPTGSCPWLKVAPQAISWGPRLAKEVFRIPHIYITENGCGFERESVQNGEILDLHRRDYVRNYLKEIHRAIQDGVPIEGYFLWSFMDNFEWQDGYATRFGIVHVDYKTQKRTPKLSAHWYARVMREGRIV